MITVLFDRTSVCAGDDVDSHSQTVVLPSGLEPQDFLNRLLGQVQLPLISGGEAVWCISGKVPLAIVAQEWSLPRILDTISFQGHLTRETSQLSLYASYLAQIDPNVAYDILSRIRFST